MAETNGAASSTADDAVDVFGGQNPTFDEYSSYRATGELPARFKPAESTDAPEKTVVVPEVEETETEPDSEPDEVQEPTPAKVPEAQKRILQLLAEVKELKRKDAERDASARPAPAQAQPQQPSAPAKPAVDDKNSDGSPKWKTYEDYIEGLAEFKADQRIAQDRFRQAEEQKLSATRQKLDEARSRYEDADSVIFPAAEAIQNSQISPVIKQVIADSDVFTDLLYVIGSDKAELDKFLRLAQSKPREALALAFDYERGVKEELAKGNGAGTTESGKATEKKPTSAPRPPSPVGGSSTRSFDVSDESLSPEQWMRRRNEQLAKRGKG